MSASLALSARCPRIPVPAGIRRLLANGLHADLLAMGSAQVAVRVSRLVTTVVLARLLSPDAVGLAAVVLTIYELIALVTRNGLAARVVQARADEVEQVAETAHALTWFICGGLMLVQFAIAVPVALAFGDMRLALPVAAMGLVYLATPLSSIQGAFIQRAGGVRRFAAASAVQVIADNLLSALLAVAGLGMWAIILPKLLVAPIWVVFLRWGHPWRARHWPGRHLTGGREILRFGRSVVGVELMTTLQANLDNLMVGWFLGAAALGMYFFAFNAGLGITLGLVNAFGVAVFPHLCAAREDPAELARRYRHTLRTLALVVVPVVLLQVALAPLYVPVVFGPQWGPAIPVLMIICLSALPRPFASAASQLLKAVGRPEIELRWQTGLTVAFVAAVLVGLPFGLVGVALAVLTVQVAGLSAFCLLVPRRVLADAGHAGQPQDTQSQEEKDPAMSGRVIEIVTTPARLAALRPEWQALWQRVPGAHVAQGFDWCRTGWTTTAEPRGRRLWILVLRVDGVARLIWPLVLATRPGHVVALGLGSESSEYDPLLVAPGADARANVEAAHAFVRTFCPADIVEIGFAEETSPRARVLAGDTRTRRAHALAAPEAECRSHARLETYLATRPAKLRTELRRRRRQLAGHGRLWSGFLTEPEAIVRAIDWALARKAEWLARRNEGNAFLHTPEYRAFLLEMARRPDGCGRLAVMAMTLDDRLVAVKIGAIDAVRFEGFLTVYDPALASVSPGSLLLADCIGWCIATGRDYDFRIGEEAYKRSWETGSRTVTRFEIANRPRGAVVLALREAGQTLREWRDGLRRRVPESWRQRLRRALGHPGPKAAGAPAGLDAPAPGVA